MIPIFFTRAEDGDPYYHNSTTGETVWDMPKCLEIVAKRAKRKPVPVNWKPITETIWMEVETDDGRTYYHNTKTNVKNFVGLPPEYVQ